MHIYILFYPKAYDLLDSLSVDIWRNTFQISYLVVYYEVPKFIGIFLSITLEFLVLSLNSMSIINITQLKVSLAGFSLEILVIGKVASFYRSEVGNRF